MNHEERAGFRRHDYAHLGRSSRNTVANISQSCGLTFLMSQVQFSSSFMDLLHRCIGFTQIVPDGKVTVWVGVLPGFPKQTEQYVVAKFRGDMSNYNGVITQDTRGSAITSQAEFAERQ